MKNPNAALVSGALCLCLLAPMTDVHAQSDADIRELMTRISYTCTNYYEQRKPSNELVKMCFDRHENASTVSMVWGIFLGRYLNYSGRSKEEFKQEMSSLGLEQYWKTGAAVDIEEMCENTMGEEIKHPDCF